MLPCHKVQSRIGEYKTKYLPILAMPGFQKEKIRIVFFMLHKFNHVDVVVYCILCTLD